MGLEHGFFPSIAAVRFVSGAAVVDHLRVILRRCLVALLAALVPLLAYAAECTQYRASFQSFTGEWSNNKADSRQSVIDAANAAQAGCTTTTVYNGTVYSTCPHYRVYSEDGTSFVVAQESEYCTARFGGYPTCGTVSTGGYTTRTGDYCAGECDWAAGKTLIAFGTFAAPVGSPICQLGCVFGRNSTPNVGGIKWKADESPTSPWMEEVTTGHFTGTGTSCAATTEVEPVPNELPPPGKCPGTVNGVTVYADCKVSETTLSGSSTRSISVGTGTATLGDSMEKTITCVNGTCTTVINQTTTVVSGGGVLTPGSSTTGTATVTGGSGGGGTAGDGDCADDTSLIKCGKFDSPGDEKPLRETATFSFTPYTFNVWGGSDTCPSPLTFTIAGHDYPFSFEYTCMILGTYVKPLVLLLSAFAAFMILSRPES